MIEIGTMLDIAISAFKRFRWLTWVLPLAAFVGWQTWQAHHWHKIADQRGVTIDQMAAASKQALAAQLAANSATEARYRAQAEKADHDHQIALASAYDAADRYIRNNRVQPDHSRSAKPASAAAEDHGSGVPAAMPADAVLVSAGDVQACTGAVAYAIDAHNHAVDQVNSEMASGLPELEIKLQSR